MEHRRSRLQHAEREWSAHAARRPARAVYWPMRYTPPPAQRRPMRAALGALLTVGVGLGFGVLGALDLIARDAALVLFAAAEVCGLYLICTTPETTD
jgi:hypothetical protein